MSEDKKIKKVEEKVRTWLLDEGFKIESLSDEHAHFNFLAEDKHGRKVNIAQPIKKTDQVVIATRAILTQKQQQKLMMMESESRNRFFWTLRFGLLNRGVGFSGIGPPLESVRVSRNVYYDGLSKDKFVDILLEVRKALLFIMWMVDRELGEPEPTLKPSYVS